MTPYAHTRKRRNAQESYALKVEILTRLAADEPPAYIATKLPITASYVYVVEREQRLIRAGKMRGKLIKIETPDEAVTTPPRLRHVDLPDGIWLLLKHYGHLTPQTQREVVRWFVYPNVPAGLSPVGRSNDASHTLPA